MKHKLPRCTSISTNIEHASLHSYYALQHHPSSRSIRTSSPDDSSPFHSFVTHSLLFITPTFTIYPIPSCVPPCPRIYPLFVAPSLDIIIPSDNTHSLNHFPSTGLQSPPNACLDSLVVSVLLLVSTPKCGGAYIVSGK